MGEVKEIASQGPGPQRQRMANRRPWITISIDRGNYHRRVRSHLRLGATDVIFNDIESWEKGFTPPRHSVAAVAKTCAQQHIPAIRPVQEERIRETFSVIVFPIDTSNSNYFMAVLRGAARHAWPV